MVCFFRADPAGELGTCALSFIRPDHLLAHAHVVAPDRSNAIFYLNCPDGPVSLRSSDGLSARQLKRIAAVLEPHVPELCAA